MIANALLGKDHIAAIRTFDQQRRKQHHRRKHNNAYDRTRHIDSPFDHAVNRIAEGQMPDIDNGKSRQIFDIRLGGNYAIVIRYKLCVDAGFFTDIDQLLQLSIISQS